MGSIFDPPGFGDDEDPRAPKADEYLDYEEYLNDKGLYDKRVRKYEGDPGGFETSYRRSRRFQEEKRYMEQEDLLDSLPYMNSGERAEALNSSLGRTLGFSGGSTVGDSGARFPGGREVGTRRSTPGPATMAARGESHLYEGARAPLHDPTPEPDDRTFTRKAIDLGFGAYNKVNPRQFGPRQAARQETQKQFLEGDLRTAGAVVAVGAALGSGFIGSGRYDTPPQFTKVAGG